MLVMSKEGGIRMKTPPKPMTPTLAKQLLEDHHAYLTPEGRKILENMVKK